MSIELILLRQMHRIRLIEEEIANRYPQGKMRCPTHLSIGQEAVAAAIGTALRSTDLVVSGHRAHAHYLGKGGNLTAMIAEIYGKVTGCARGKGGSMHLIDLAAGFVGSTAIVGGTVPVGVGLGYGIKQRRTNDIACVFLGEAVAETGVLYESINFAVLKHLPILFICENNLYSVYSPLRVRQPAGREIWKIVESMGVKAANGDGNDVLKVYEMASTAIETIRNGGGPMFLEFNTYRWREHCGPHYDNNIGYRTEAEFEAWRRRDPIAKLQDLMLCNGQIDQVTVDDLLQSIREEINASFMAAEASPFPPREEAFLHVYS